jgi:hypothetical protein
MNILQKLNEVRKKVPYIKKDTEVAGKYMAITHDAVTAQVREHLIEQGIIIVPEVMSSEVITTTMTTGRGIPIIRYQARFNIHFMNCDEPADRVNVMIDAHAMDEGDKAPGKATSMATKVAVLKLLSIETGVDEESRMAVKPKVAEVESMIEDIKDAKVTPTSGAWESMSVDEQTFLNDIATTVISFLGAGQASEACGAIDRETLDADEKVALWTRFSAPQRSAMTKEYAKRKEPA